MFLALKTNHSIFYLSLLFNILFIAMLMKYMEVSINLPIKIEYVNESPRETFSKVSKKVRVLF